MTRAEEKEKLIEAAFAAMEALNDHKRSFDIAQELRDFSLRKLVEAAGTGPFEHPKTKTKYQVICRGSSRYFREVK